MSAMQRLSDAIAQTDGIIAFGPVVWQVSCKDVEPNLVLIVVAVLR